MAQNETPEQHPMHTYPCSQAYQIKKLVEAIEGNGKKGLRVEMALVKDHVASIDTRISEIQLSLSSKAEVDLEIEVDRRVNAKLDQKKLQEEIKARQIIEGKMNKRGEFRSFILVGVAILSLLLSFYVNFRATRAVEQSNTQNNESSTTKNQ